MNEKYFAGNVGSGPAPSLRRDEVKAERSPMLPMLLNDLNAATNETSELLDQLESRLEAITSLSDPEPGPPENKEPVCFPPALEMLRNMLKRTQAVNRQMVSLLRRVEI